MNSRATLSSFLWCIRKANPKSSFLRWRRFLPATTSEGHDQVMGITHARFDCKFAHGNVVRNCPVLSRFRFPSRKKLICWKSKRWATFIGYKPTLCRTKLTRWASRCTALILGIDRNTRGKILEWRFLSNVFNITETFIITWVVGGPAAPYLLYFGRIEGGCVEAKNI